MIVLKSHTPNEDLDTKRNPITVEPRYNEVGYNNTLL